MKHTSKKIIESTNLLLSILVIIGIIINALPTFFWQDDLSLYVALKKNNILTFLWNSYLNFDGRRATLPGLIQAILIKYTSAQIGVFFWTITFLGSVLFTLKLLNINKNKLVNFALISASLIFVFKVHVFQTIYWTTGGYYIFCLLLASVWLYLYSKKYQKRGIIFPLLTILLGASTQNLTVSLITLVIIDILHERWEQKKWNKSRLMILFYLLPGLIYISLAPGNVTRSGSLKEIELNFSSLISSAHYLYYRAFALSKFAIPTTLILALFCYNKIKPSNNHLLFNILKYLIAALISIAPFILLPPYLSRAGRIFIYFQYFLFITLFYGFTWGIHLFFAKFQTAFFYKTINVITQTGIFIFLVFSTVIFSLNFKSGIHIKNQVKEREKIIINSPSNIDIVLNPINLEWKYSNFMHFFYDFNTSTEYFSNKAAKEYYNKKSISVKSKETESN